MCTENNWTVYFCVHRAEGLSAVPNANELSFYSPWQRRVSVPLSHRPGFTFPQAVFSLNASESSEHIWNSLSSRLNPDVAVSFRCTADLPGFEMIFCCNMWNFIACLLRSSSCPSMLSFDFSFSLSSHSGVGRSAGAVWWKNAKNLQPAGFWASSSSALCLECAFEFIQGWTVLIQLLTLNGNVCLCFYK